MFRVFAFVLIAVVMTACQPGAGALRPDPQTDTAGVSDAQRAVLEARVRASNTHDWDTWQSLHTEDCVRTAPELDKAVIGSTHMRADIEKLTASFPDYHLALVRAMGHGNQVMAELAAWGTFSRPMKTSIGLDIPPSNKSFYQHWMVSIRFKNGKIAEFHEFWDQKDVNDQVMGMANPKPWW